MQDNSGGLSEVHSASSVLNLSRHNGCDRYIAKTFKPSKGSAVRQGQKQSGTAYFTSLFFQGRFLYPFAYGCEVDEAYSVKNMRSRVVPRKFYVPVEKTGTFYFVFNHPTGC